jgi:hypothetical protein
MRADGPDPGSFEETVRAIAQEVGQSIEHLAGQLDVKEIAGVVGVDPERAREWIATAGGWLGGQVTRLGDEAGLRAAGGGEASDQDPLLRAAAHPLDLPTEEQGLALAALESGRWTIEPGSAALAARGEGSGPAHSLGLARDLHVRDWIATDGEVTLAGRHALSRWLEAAASR